MWEDLVSVLEHVIAQATAGALITLLGVVSGGLGSRWRLDVALARRPTGVSEALHDISTAAPGGGGRSSKAQLEQREVLVQITGLCVVL